MIYDTLENLNQYTGLFENLDTAIEYIENNDLSLLPIGDTSIDGEKVYVKIFETQTKTTQECKFETHTKYMDLQMDLVGTEICEVSLGNLTVTQEYNEETDCAFYDGELTSALVMGQGRFAVFMVEEAHKPGVKAHGCDTVKKAVFKIAY